MKQKLLKIVNPILFLSAFFQLFSGLFGERLHAEWLEEGHDINGIVLGVLIVAHIVLNWAWIKSQFKRDKKKA